MTRENTSHPKAGGEHEDAEESGMPKDVHSEGAGPEDKYTSDAKPSSTPNHLEEGDYPEPGQETAGGGGHNHRILPTPSKANAGGRGVTNVKGVIGDGRGSSGKFEATIGRGGTEPKYKGTMGC